jgi:hypothetical protein
VRPCAGVKRLRCKRLTQAGRRYACCQSPKSLIPSPRQGEMIEKSSRVPSRLRIGEVSSAPCSSFIGLIDVLQAGAGPRKCAPEEQRAQMVQAGEPEQAFRIAPTTGLFQEAC